MDGEETFEGRWWAVYGECSEANEPLAIFPSKQVAETWLTAMDAADELYRDRYHIERCDLVASVWNSTDPDPRPEWEPGATYAALEGRIAELDAELFRLSDRRRLVEKIEELQAALAAYVAEEE